MQQLPDFSYLNILIVGDIMLDQYIYGSIERVSPEAPVPVLDWKKTGFKAGGAANVAMNILAMGASPVLLSVVGEDRDGERLKKELLKEGLNSDHLIQSKEKITTVKTRLIAGGQQVMRIDEEDSAYISEKLESALINRFDKLVKNNDFDAILVEDYNKGLLTEKIIRHISSFASGNSILLTVDPKHNNFFCYRSFDLFKPNLREVNDILKKSFEPNLKDLIEASAILKEKIAFKNLMITVGEHGIFIDSGNVQEIIPTSLRDVVDVCGAGDAVISMATLCMATGLSLSDSAVWANKAGGVVCKTLGVSAVDREQLEKN